MEIPASIRFRKPVSPFLQIIRLAPADPGSPLPAFEAGQALELIAPRVKLVRKLSGAERYVYERDPDGGIAAGRMALWYSIASSPGETARHGFVEFFVSLHDVEGEAPRFLLEGEEPLRYGDQPRGDFTMSARASGARQIIIAATGTGIAPVVSMIKDLHEGVLEGRETRTSITLFHGHRTLPELGYADELRSLERSGAIDFVYLPMLTRPSASGGAAMGSGRVTEAIRSVLRGGGGGATARLPGGHSAADLRRRMEGSDAVILACGGVAMLQEMAAIAHEAGIRFEQEGW